MKAIVLVGGEGTRLRPLTFRTPKPLLPIANVPFLERQLAWLAGHGVDEVVLSLGYLPEAFEAHFASGTFQGMRIRWVIEKEPLGTAGGIRFAAEGIDEQVVVCNGDVLTDLDLTELVRFHDERGAEATIALTQVEDPSAFGVVPTRDGGEVVAFVEKPPAGKAPTNWINAGTYVLEPRVLARIPPRLTVSIERETFPRMLGAPRRLFAQHSDAYWIDIGTPRKYAEAHADVLAGRLGFPPAPGAVERSRGVWVQDGVEIHPEAKLRGPVLLGEGSRIGAGADVADSVLGPGAVVEAGSRVLRSIVLASGRVDADDKAVDVVIAPDARLECGA